MRLWGRGREGPWMAAVDLRPADPPIQRSPTAGEGHPFAALQGVSAPAGRHAHTDAARLGNPILKKAQSRLGARQVTVRRDVGVVPDGLGHRCGPPATKVCGLGYQENSDTCWCCDECAGVPPMQRPRHRPLSSGRQFTSRRPLRIRGVFQRMTLKVTLKMIHVLSRRRQPSSSAKTLGTWAAAGGLCIGSPCGSPQGVSSTRRVICRREPPLPRDMCDDGREASPHRG